MRDASIFSNASFKVSWTKLNISLDFLMKNKSFPKNLCSSSEILNLSVTYVKISFWGCVETSLVWASCQWLWCFSVFCWWSFVGSWGWMWSDDIVIRWWLSVYSFLLVVFHSAGHYWLVLLSLPALHLGLVLLIFSDFLILFSSFGLDLYILTSVALGSLFIYLICLIFFTFLARCIIWSSGIVIAKNLAIARLSCGAYGIFKSSYISLTSLGQVLKLDFLSISCIRLRDLPLLSSVVVIWMPKARLNLWCMT